LEEKVEDKPRREEGSAFEGETVKLKEQLSNEPRATQRRHLLGSQPICRKKTE
jgi:hypothetical protein